MRLINQKNTFKIILFIVFFLASAVTISIASDIYSKFFKEIASVSTWEELKEISIEYPDDGIFAEGFSDKVGWLFQNKYSDFFKKEIFKDKKFYIFIKRHIDQTWEYGSVEKLKMRIENDCPQGYKIFCDELLKNIEEVIKDNMIDRKL